MQLAHKDIVKHIIASYILSVLFFFLSKNNIFTFIGVIFLGIIKEAYDHFKKNKNTFHESALDMAANFIGISAGYLSIIFLFS